MIRFIVVLVLGPIATFGQLRMSKLEIPKGDTFVIRNTDIMVIDTLVLGDSSAIQLNREKTDNYPCDYSHHFLRISAGLVAILVACDCCSQEHPRYHGNTKH